VDPIGDGGRGLTATGLICAACGTELPLNSKFCNECGAPVTKATRSAEYKQVTVLFADVVHSMDIAATVGAERLREIMAELVNRAAAPAGDITRWPRTGSVELRAASTSDSEGNHA
jgi:adenylate cyclase